MSVRRVFLDTNVLVYAYDVDAEAKHDIARDLLLGLWEAEAAVVSVQVLQEFYVTVTRKLPKPMSKRAAREILETYDAWPVHRPTVEDAVFAAELEERHRLSFWDALVVVSAQRSGAETLLSEDLQHDRRIEGVRIENPFAATAV
jgi:predicted nucleic acid-binding protein